MNPFDLLNSALCARLALALAHSLWLGAAVLIGTVTLAWLCRKQSPRAR